MGAYISVPFVAKKTVACEPASKQESTEQLVRVIKTEVKAEVKTEINTEMKEAVQETVEKPAPIQEAAPVVEEKKEIVAMKEETVEEKKEEEKKEEEKKEEEKKEKKEEDAKQKMADQTLKECMEIEATMAKVSVSELKIKLPEEISENVVVSRAPEFRNQSQPESHAVKKFNKKHRKN